MVLLSSFLNGFKKVLGMFVGPNAFLILSELIFKVSSSLSIDISVKASSTGSER